MEPDNKVSIRIGDVLKHSQYILATELLYVG